MSIPPPLHPLIRLRLLVKLWPGLIALLSLVAVWGHQTPHPDGPRTLLTAGQAALPELRAMPAPTPGPGLLSAAEAEAAIELPTPAQGEVVLGQAQREDYAPDLTALGRQQTDGG